MKATMFVGQSPDIERCAEVLDSLMFALIDSNKYQIRVSGIESELPIRPRYHCLKDVELMFERKDCVAVIKNGFDGDVDMSDNAGSRERFTVDFEESWRYRLGQDRPPSLWPLMWKEFQSFCAKQQYRCVWDRSERSPGRVY